MVRNTCVVALVLIALCPRNALEFSVTTNSSAPETDKQLPSTESEDLQNSSVTQNDTDRNENNIQAHGNATVTFLHNIESPDESDFDYEGVTTNPNIYVRNYELDKETCPPVANLQASRQLCEMTSCNQDEDCGGDGSRKCCFNGCIRACMPKVNPPIAVDWVEESQLKFSEGDIGKNAQYEMASKPEEMRKKDLADSEENDQVAVPGGCFLTSDQFEHLKLFRQHDHVKTCTCSKGEVFCEVKHNTLSSTSASTNKEGEGNNINVNGLSHDHDLDEDMETPTTTTKSQVES